VSDEPPDGIQTDAGVAPAHEIVLVRHAETAWSRAHRHTGRSDIPLTDAGRAAAMALAPRLADLHFEGVLCSPAARARETCDLCGFGDAARLHDDLWEWDYGAYEGLTTVEIVAERPDWRLWRDGCPDGETAAAVGERADRVIAEALGVGGNVAIFSHGHMLRVLAARWLGLDASVGAGLALATSSLSILGYERQTRVIWRWNA
jgi:probable phosphoglycerate mutase